MAKLIRQLKISLATKCQLLFGFAVVLVICAALFVPWQRMEQLTAQPNLSAARILADQIVLEHVEFEVSAATRPSLREIGRPSTLPTGEYESRHPRLIGVGRVNDSDVTRFENGSIRAFQRDTDREYRGNLVSSINRYRYAHPLFARAGCIQCHAESTASPTVAAATAPSETALQQPPQARLLGIVSVDIPSQTSGQQQLLNRVFLLVAGLIAGTLAGVTLYLIITRIILQPMRVLQETAEKVSAGDLNIRSHINSGDEFQQLSETFNQMLANLKGSNDKLREANKSLDVRLGQLAESNTALYESNKLKSEFLANVSHELRTPLNSILGFADLLRDATPPDPKLARYLQNIIRSGNSLLELINDLLDLAKIEAGKLDIRVTPLSLNDLFEGLANLLKPLCEPKKLTIVQRVQPDVPILQTDPGRLQQVLYNFLSNAIKFSPNGETIDLTAAATSPNIVRISVTDHGPGIPPDMQQMIFEKFRQADASHTREHGGTGLGLSISKELASLLGGTTGVLSIPGEGATFWCELPVAIESGEREVIRAIL